MRIVSYIIVLLIVVLGLTFAALNAEPVDFNYYLGVQHFSLSLLLVYALGIGIILGMLVLIMPLLKLKRENARLKKQNKNLEQELTGLRHLPVKSDL